MEIVTSWMEEGLVKGREEGREAVRDITLRFLRRQVGALSPDIEARVHGLSLEDLRALSEALVEFRSVADLEAWFAAR